MTFSIPQAFDKQEFLNYFFKQSLYLVASCLSCDFIFVVSLSSSIPSVARPTLFPMDLGEVQQKRKKEMLI
jgi:hypothetical protein